MVGTTLAFCETRTKRPKVLKNRISRFICVPRPSHSLSRSLAQGIRTLRGEGVAGEELQISSAAGEPFKIFDDILNYIPT